MLNVNNINKLREILHAELDLQIDDVMGNAKYEEACWVLELRHDSANENDSLEVVGIESLIVPLMDGGYQVDDRITEYEEVE